MVGALSATVLAVAGCGSSGDSYDNADRPPATRSISIALTSNGVSVSPSRIGGGPTLLLIANESGRSRELTLTPRGGAGRSCVEADTSSGPINPQGTARLQLSLLQGTCVVGVAGDGLAPARLTVGPQRESSQQDLLQP
jgi:hypothetical protein